MANPEHLAILEKGVEAWNKWRDANIRNPKHFRGPDLSDADLRGARLIRANFTHADLRVTDLSGAELMEADLSYTQLSGASLRHTNLSHADLRGADVSGVILDNADLTNITADLTNFGDLDLSRVKGLASVVHHGPSTIGIDTIYNSKGNIPEQFLRGAGVPEPFITHMKALVGAMEPILFYSCFISYSTKDQHFADRLHSDLHGKSVRCWLATEDLKIGDNFRSRIEESIRVHDKLLLVLSKASLASPWVEDEVESALERERREHRLVLFPIRIDDAVMETDVAWAAHLRQKRHIGEFIRWKDHDAYQKAFERLLRDLKAEARSEQNKNTAKDGGETK